MPDMKYQNVDISEVVEKNKFQGAILAKSKGETILEQGFGFADEENAILNTPETVFRIGSLSKQFTGVAILLLQERGMLSTNDTLEQYFPTLTDGKRITIHHLMTMTSGLDRDFVQYKIQNNTNIELGAFLEKYASEIDKFYFTSHSKKEQLALLNEKPLLSSPGSKYYYSNIGYTLAAYIVEQASGLSFYKYLRKNIFEPFGLKNTHTADDGKKAKDYNPDLNNMEFDESILFGGGGICTNVYDFDQWIHLLHSGKVLSENAYRQMMGGTDNKTENYFRYGIKINEGIISLGGGLFTATSFYYYDPKNDKTVMVFSNHLSGKMETPKVAGNVAKELWRQLST